ncbi:MAG TPA: serine hydrolase, partial [Roseiflexaceae bacterium]
MFDPLRFAKKLDDQLIGKAVGYEYAVYEGETLSTSGAGGYAVLPHIPMTADRRMSVASMSKTITATAFMRALEILNAAGANIKINSKIAPYLPLAWEHGPRVDEMTFKDLLNHVSGLRSVDDQDLFDSLKQTIANGSSDADWKHYFYENPNYTLFRILIPNMLYGVGVSGPDLPGGESPDRCTARIYFNFVRDKVLGPIGLSSVSVAPKDPHEVSTYYAFSDPSKTSVDPSFEWFFLRAGAGHWYMSAKEFGRFIAGLRNGKIVSSASFQQMRDFNLGIGGPDTSTREGANWDHSGEGGGDAAMQGDWMILPNDITAVILTNSKGGLKKTLQDIMRNAFNAAWLTPAITDVAPAAASLGNRIYVVIKGDDQHIYLNPAVDGQPCSGWMEVEGHGTTQLAPGAASLGNRIYALVRGINDKHIYVTSALAGQPFDGFGFGWTALPNVMTDVTPAAASLGNRIYVFAKGINDKQIYVNSALDGQALDGNGWSAIPGVTTDVAPAAASLGNRIYVFAKGINDKQIYVNSALPGQPFDGWGNGWSAIPGVTTDVAPAAASLGNRLYVFAKGLNNRIYVNSALDGQAMGNWKEVEGNATTDAAPAAASLGGRVYVFAKGINDRRIFVNS